MHNPFLYLFDPVLRAPTWASMLLALSAALLGVPLFLRRQSLLGETLAHATYPGITFAVVFLALTGRALSPSVLLIGAFASALGGMGVMHVLTSRFGVKRDAALCFILASFFGLGLLIASIIQQTHPLAYAQIQSSLFGSVATCVDGELLPYALFGAGVGLFFVLFHKEVLLFSFDADFAVCGVRGIRRVRALLFILVVLAVVLGIRSVGVVLIAAMLIAPPVAARQWTDVLSKLLIFSGLVGVLSGWMGVYLSTLFSLPTGPVIVLVASFFAFASLLFAPKRGLGIRYLRIWRFRILCLQENLLKAIWRKAPKGALPWTQVRELLDLSPFLMRWTLFRLRKKGWLIQREGRGIQLTCKGRARGARIVRLHRLWEVYLVSALGMGQEKVHRSAEEVEHLLTPELEAQLAESLRHPTLDPHKQPIPAAVNPEECPCLFQ